MTDPTPDTFPYAEGETGLPLPVAAARGVLATAETGDSRTSTASDSRHCPDCGGELINGAGLFACGDCEWYGSLR